MAHRGEPSVQVDSCPAPLLLPADSHRATSVCRRVVPRGATQASWLAATSKTSDAAMMPPKGRQRPPAATLAPPHVSFITKHNRSGLTGTYRERPADRSDWASTRRWASSAGRLVDRTRRLGGGESCDFGDVGDDARPQPLSRSETLLPTYPLSDRDTHPLAVQLLVKAQQVRLDQALSRLVVVSRPGSDGERRDVAATICELGDGRIDAVLREPRICRQGDVGGWEAQLPPPLVPVDDDAFEDEGRSCIVVSHRLRS
jgi:hypothetical protein